jgi:predicted DNA-binding WGR domain protein/tetratricopeptide (TPR) repeat protein
MSWREFSFVQGNSRKFWNIERSGNAVTVHFGRTGTSGRKQTREFASLQKANAAYERLIAEKLGKGYRELPAKLKKPPAESLARTRLRVGQRWSFKTDVRNIHPVLQILEVEEHPRKGVFCFVDIKFHRAVTIRPGRASEGVPGILLCLTAEALERSLDQLVDAKAPLPDHYQSAGEFTAAAPESLLQDPTTDIEDSTLDEAILNHLGQIFPARVARKMGWPVRPKARDRPRPPAPPEQEVPPAGPQEQAQQRQSVAMAEAIARGDLEQVRALVAANPAVVNTPLRIDRGQERLNPAGVTEAPPLHFAAAHRKRKVVELLLELGAKVNATSEDGRTPLFVAVWPAKPGNRGAKQVVQLLEQHGAAMDLNSAIWLRRLDWVKQHLRTHKPAVQEAPFPGRLIEDTIHMTEFRIVDEIVKDHLDGEPEGAAAIYADAREIIEMLLDRGADPNGQSGSALFYAVQMPDPAVAKLLLERGADPNRGLAEGEAVYLPEIAESAEMRELLLCHGAREDPYHPRRNYRAKGYVSVWLGRFGSKRKFTKYTTDPDMRGKVAGECFKEDFGVDVFDAGIYEEHFSPKPLAVRKLLDRFASCDSFIPAAAGKAKADGWRSANCASLIYDFRYEADPGKARRDCPMKFVGAFPYWDEERLDNLLDRGKYAQALTEINRAIELYPDSADYIGTRGWIHEQLGKYALAKADFEQAFRLGEGGDSASDSANNLAWILATAPAPEMRDAARALELALRACKASRWKDPGHLGTLAAAYANNGQFEEAISWQEKAIAREYFRQEKAELRAALKLYRAGQPYRLPPRSE